jgi:site-specific DNA recombinase
MLQRLVYTGDAAAFATRSIRRAGGGYARRPGSDAEIVLVRDIAPAIITPGEHTAVLERLAMNQANSARNNRYPEATLLRAGFMSCGHCGHAMSVVHARTTRPGSSSQYRCDPSGQRGTDCPRPSIAASMIDDAVWAKVAAVLRDPAIISAEVAKQREDGGLERDHTALDKQIVSIAEKRARLARRVADIADDDVAAPLIAELRALAALKTAAEAEREVLIQRITDRDAETARVKTLTDWCATVNANLETLTYDEKRLALKWLGVHTRVHRVGAIDAMGNPMPRWELTMGPTPPDEQIANGCTPAP